MRNKKIIALVCALSIIFSIFASFTVVNAAIEKGIELEITQESNTAAKLTAKYIGYADGVSSSKIVFNLPEGVTVTKHSTPLNPQGGLPNAEVAGEYSYTIVLQDNTKAADHDATTGTGTLAEFELSFADGLSKNETIALKDTSEIGALDEDFNTVMQKADALPATSDTLKKDINAVVEETPAPLDKPTVTDAPKPSAEPVVEVGEKGIDLTATKVDDTHYTLTAKYVGYPEGVSSTKVIFNLPDGASVTKHSTPLNPQGGLPNTEVAGEYSYTIVLQDNTKAADHENGTGTLAEFELTLANKLADDAKITLKNTSEIGTLDEDFNTVMQKGDQLNLVSAVLEADKAADTREEAKLADSITPADVKAELDKINAIADADEKAAALDKTYLAVEATKNDGKDKAEYGPDKDYVAYYNGVELTEAQLNNILAGAYADDEENPITLEDAVKGLTFKYNNGVNLKFQLVANDEVAKEETTKNEDPGNNNPTTDSIPVISVKSSTTQVTAGEGTVVKVYVDKVTNPNKDGKLTVTISDGALDLVTGSGITFVEDGKDPVALKADGKTANEIEIGTASDKYIKFVGAVKGTITFTFNYTATGDVTGSEVKAGEQKKTITIKAAGTTTTTTSSDSSKSSGGGAIATGLVDTGTGALPGIGFSDMGDAEWARDAVTALSLRNIVSGYPDGTFDPNGALTRAAYAQMLVNAIGHQGDSADTSFDDVPTDAWFYHNVAVAAQLGIVSGYGDGNFGPYDLITREQMALMTQKAAVVMQKSLVGADAGVFTDDADIADWSKAAVYELANAGIINGMGDGTFAPKANATRAQAATIIYNAFIK